jgi:type IV secretory pathway VirB2 component (pilin)
MKTLLSSFAILSLSFLTVQAISSGVEVGGPCITAVDWFNSGTGKALATFIALILVIVSLFKKLKWRYSLLSIAIIFTIFGAANIIGATDINKYTHCL